MIVSQLMSTKKTTMFPISIFQEKGNRSYDAGNSTKESKFSKPCIKFGHVNARSLYPKLDEINAVVVKHDVDVFCIGETYTGRIDLMLWEAMYVFISRTISPLK